MRVHVVDAENRAKYRTALDQHHQLRHQIYIGERRWRALKGVDGREYDQFDLPDAIYLLAITDQGEVAGGTRLLQSVGSTLLSDVFPQLADIRPFERAPDVLEWTRFFVAPRFRESGRLCHAGGLISAAMIKYCLDSGIRKLNAVGETYWMPRISALGWRPQSLGFPIEYDDMSICAWTIDITWQALQTTLDHYALQEVPLLHESHRRRRDVGTPAVTISV